MGSLGASRSWRHEGKDSKRGGRNGKLKGRERDHEGKSGKLEGREGGGSWRSVSTTILLTIGKSVPVFGKLDHTTAPRKYTKVNPAFELASPDRPLAKICSSSNRRERLEACD